MMLIAIALIGEVPATAAKPVRNRPVTPVITVNTDRIICRSYEGLGVQWDPSFVDYTPAQWQQIFQRVTILHPQFIRCCYMATSYCTGFNSEGLPVFDWNSVDMRRLYPILNYCQSHHIKVLLGEWGPPFGMKIDDPRWSTLITDELQYLIRQRGYTCIKWFNKQNEPSGDKAYFQQWRTSQLSLNAALTRTGLTKYVKQVGPDTSGERLFSWVHDCAKQLSIALGAYEIHWYVPHQDISSGHVVNALRDVRTMINRTDAHGSDKPFILGESGTSDTVGSKTGDWRTGDSNLLIRSPQYGTLMADYAIQTMRAGLAGMSAWDLDDSMHEQMAGGVPPTAANPHGYNLKVWGFWNTLGPAMGDPADDNLRPWFYAWTMLCRHFPRGSRIVLTNNPTVRGVRSTAAIVTENGRTALSFAIVNDADTARTIDLKVPNAVGLSEVREFSYTYGSTKATLGGMPLPNRTLHEARLSKGVVLQLPPHGFLVLTTMGESQPLKLTTGRIARTTHIQLISADGTDELLPRTTLQFRANVQPEQVPVRWSVTAPNGMATTLATVNQQGLVTAHRTGVVLLTAKSSSPGSVKAASTTLHIVNSKSISDYLSNWSKSYSHTSGLAFDNLHASQFEGQTVRVKRISDTAQSIVYQMAHITGFRIKVFYTGHFNDQVAVEVSADGVHWRSIPTLRTTVTTTSDFQPAYLSPATQVPDSEYLRVTLQNNKVVYAPQLAEVVLKASVPLH